MESAGINQSVPPFPIHVYTVTEEAIKRRLRYSLTIAIASGSSGTLILAISPLFTKPIPVWLIMVVLAKLQLILTVILLFVIGPTIHSLRSLRIEIQGTEIRQMGKGGKLLATGDMRDITSLRTIGSLFNRDTRTYVASFGKWKMISFIKGMQDEDELISTIERHTQKHF